MATIHISLTAEPLFHVGPIMVTNALLTSWVVVGTMIAVAVAASKRFKIIPSYGQMLLEIPIEALYNITKNVAGHRAVSFFPYVATFFIFILLSNLSGLVPGVGTIGLSEHNAVVPFFRAPTADLNTTLALALISVSLVQYHGIKTFGRKYLSKFFTIKNPILTFVGLLEFVSEIAKVVSFTFRLFGNIFAGEVLLVVTSALIPVIAPVPFYGLELFVGLIQAVVFSMLTLVFLNMATEATEHSSDA
jgi:F-type H+-transporting ATPase subunit a